MNTNLFITLTAAIISGGIITVMAGYFIVKNQIEQYLILKKATLDKDVRASLLPLRLQAHERIILFIERINPSNLLIRVHQPGIELAALQVLVVNEINTEYQHNIAQQLYVNTVTWNTLKKLKDDSIAMINNAAQHLPADAQGIELSKKVLQHMSNIEDNPYDFAIGLVKKDIHKLF
jgi:hypothetical protein